MAFILVTTLRSDGLEAITAETLTLHTLGVVYTVEIRMTQDADAGLLTKHLRTRPRREALGTQTGVARLGVLTHRVDPAWPVIRLTLIDVNTAYVGVSCKVLPALT